MGTNNERTANRGRWAGRTLSGLAIAFLAFDAVGKLLELQPVIAGSAELGYPVRSIFGIGLVLAICVVLYAIPRTSALGAVLLTGYLGGAVASQVRVGNPLFTHELFPLYVAVLVWGGLLLRDRPTRALLAWRER